MRTIGLDVHKHFAEVAIVEPGQPVKAAARVPATPYALRGFAEQLGPDDQVVMEATFNTWAIAELLSTRAGRVVVSNPMRTRAIASAKVKTDRIDAAVLAQLLAADFLPEVWVPDARIRALRRQVSQRSSLVQQRSRWRNRIQSILNRNLLECPHTDTFGKAGSRWLATVPLPAEERAQVDSTRRLLAALEVEIDELDRALAPTALSDPGARHLMTITGVGPTTALELVAVIGDAKRFPRPQQLVGYLGLDPRVRQSGDRPAYTGHISRQGRAHARGLLVEAAHAAIRVPGPLRAFCERVRSRRGPQIAVVAVARKLTVLAWHLLSHDADYRWAPASLTAGKLRRLELKSGSPSRRGRPTRASSVESRVQRRAQERQVLKQAEDAYRTLVTARQSKGDAGATRGERLEGRSPDAQRRSHPLPPLFSTGSTASHVRIDPSGKDGS